MLTALAAILLGAIVLLMRKGTRRHRWLGRSYLFAMLALNATALMDYELFGRFGPFHWMALISLATVVAAYVAARRRAPGWKWRHANFMAGSYVGLMAAATAEVASRVPAWSFAWSVIISSAVVIVAGLWLMKKMLPRTLSGRP